MPAYFVASYDVTDPEAYAKYSPGSIPTIMSTMTKHGGKLLAAGTENTWIAGERKTLVIMEFPTVEAAQAWEADEEYAKVKPIRLGSTGNRVEVIAPGFVPPS
ncbi:DUF1330 domain-containing protein [bacterium AH-315-N03]|nr:DUF1330 domain-containing protein [bacterium AH-315-N03]